jgi:hypothetical protein
MHARKLAVASFAFVCAFALSGMALAVPESSPDKSTAKSAEKACCKSHAGAEGSASAHCDKAKGAEHGKEGAACCSNHAAMHKEGADGAGARACCAEHAAVKNDSGKEECCCCSGEACEHSAKAAAKAAPAKS